MENNNSSAADVEPKQASEAPPSKQVDPGKTALDSSGVEVSKWSIRKKIWDHLEENDLVNFPRPCHNRIPNFVDAAVAADKAAELDVFKSARTGVKEHSKRISLKDKVTIDLVIVGSVAVSKEGYRIGKGEGFADLEFAMMATMEAVGPDTIVVTTVHDSQVVEIPEALVEDHDLTVDYIVTPTQVIATGCKRPKPQGVIWANLDYEKLYRIPVLRKLRDLEREAGKDVRLRGQEADDDERGGGRFGGRRRYGDDSADREDESNKENADDEYGEGGERGGRRRRQYRNNRYRRSKPRHSESELSDGAGGDHTEEEGKENRRPQRRRNRRRGMGNRNNSENASDGENRRSDGDDKAPRPRRPRIETSPDGVVFVGGISRRLRVSEFKSEMRGCDVHPIRLVWRGGRGFAFLHFQSADNANSAVKALAGLEIDGRELNVELARQNNRPRRSRGPKEAGSSESANQESVGSSDVPVEGAER
nr:hypothetical protein BaRGS_013998 [Batillaria attramentaria]